MQTFCFFSGMSLLAWIILKRKGKTVVNHIIRKKQTAEIWSSRDSWHRSWQRFNHQVWPVLLPPGCLISGSPASCLPFWTSQNIQGYVTHNVHSLLPCFLMDIQHQMGGGVRAIILTLQKWPGCLIRGVTHHWGISLCRVGWSWSTSYFEMVWTSCSNLFLQKTRPKCAEVKWNGIV